MSTVLTPFRVRLLGLAVLAVVAWLLPYRLNIYWISVADTALLFALLAIGMGLVMGIAGQVNLAQIAFFGVGAYATAILTTHDGYGFWVAALLAMVAAVLAGLVAGVPALRIQSHYLGIVTLGLAVAFVDWITNAPVTGGDSGISGIPTPPLFGIDLTSQYLYYYLELVVLALGLLFGLFVVRTPLGRRMRAMRDDALAAGAAGAEIGVLRMMAFGLASVYGGAAGVLYAGLIHYVAPETFSIADMFLLLAMVIIGGRQSLAGCVIGAVGLTVAQQELTNLAAYAQLGYGVVVVAVVVFAPAGLVGIPARLRRRRVRSVAALEAFQPSMLGGAEGRAEASAAAVAVPKGRRFPPWLQAGRAPRRLPSRRGGDSRRGSKPAERSEALARRKTQRGLGAEGRGAVPGVLLSVSGLVMRFRGVTALDDVSLEVRAGEILGVVGPNGSGKTTLFNVISGLYRPSGGSVRFAGRSIAGARSYRISQLGIARTFQHLRLFRHLTVLDNVLVSMDRTRSWWSWRYICWPFGVWRYDHALRSRALALLRGFGLAGFASALPAELPYGIQRRLEIARALASSPRLLLLDEPAAGLNGDEQRQLAGIVRAIRDSGVTVMIIEHNMGLVMSLCERVVVLDSGAVIASGEPGEVARDPAVLEAYLGKSALPGLPVPEASP
ncbi:MAG: branched-chain amino acid ABC transporter ATP-binding protein/permease [Streptosporangiaceae bacterium]|nr:branched-chain amino acid ABC transporter ATP-binding protein/permease [Streptosporangiaceae bacterium]